MQWKPNIYLSFNGIEPKIVKFGHEIHGLELEPKTPTHRKVCGYFIKRKIFFWDSDFSIRFNLIPIFRENSANLSVSLGILLLFFNFRLSLVICWIWKQFLSILNGKVLISSPWNVPPNFTWHTHFVYSSILFYKFCSAILQLKIASNFKLIHF